jgi:hypothetical protein
MGESVLMPIFLPLKDYASGEVGSGDGLVYMVTFHVHDVFDKIRVEQKVVPSWLVIQVNSMIRGTLNGY